MGVLMGVMLGWQLALLALFLSYTIGAIVGLFLLGSKKAKWKTQVPLGTFLVIGTLVSLLWGDMIVSWYLGVLGF